MAFSLLTKKDDNKDMRGRFLPQSLPQALLLVGPEHADALGLVQYLIASLLCESDIKNCGVCRSCQFIQQKAHPDVYFITQEKPDSAIKIDQIRELQHHVYQTAQCAEHRIIVIYPANELNNAASNALLKVLEEPPKKVHFILIATHLDTLPKTIISRCQHYELPEPEALFDVQVPGYLGIGLHYDETTSRGRLFKNQRKIIQDLSYLSENKISLCRLAHEYSTHALSDWLWFFQLLTATILRCQLMSSHITISDQWIQQLAIKHSPVHYFKQLDLVLEFVKKLNQDLPLNPTLVLETLLMGYV